MVSNFELHGRRLINSYEKHTDFAYKNYGFEGERKRIFLELVLTGVEGMAFRYHSEGRQSELRELHPVIRDLLVRVLLGR